jgi:hypothetical protein
MLKGKFKKDLNVMEIKMTINIRRGNKHLVEIMGEERIRSLPLVVEGYFEKQNAYFVN